MHKGHQHNVDGSGPGTNNGLMLTTLVLAGGRSRRMGRDKRWEPVGGIPLLRRAVEALAPLSREIVVVLASGESPPDTEGWGLGKAPLRWTHDRLPDAGPLVALSSGLLATRADPVFAVAADMPFLSPALVQHMMELAPAWDAVVPWLDNLPQPLHATYARSWLPLMEEAIGRGQRSPTDLVKHVVQEKLLRVRLLQGPELLGWAPRGRHLMDVDTPEDLTRARQEAQEGP